MNKALSLVFVPASILLFTGCALNNPSLNEVKENRVLVIEEIKKVDQESFKKSEELGIYKDKSLAAYIGPSPVLSKDEYTLLKYAEKPLLFNNYGLNNYIYTVLEQSNLQSAEEKAKMYGYKNLKEMFDHFYDINHYKNSDQILSFLKYMEQKNLISSVDNVIKKDKLEEETTKIIKTIYSPYYEYEKNIQQGTISKDWFIYLKKDKIKTNLTREDYKHFAFTVILMKEVLSANKEGVKLNGI